MTDIAWMDSPWKNQNLKIPKNKKIPNFKIKYQNLKIPNSKLIKNIFFRIEMIKSGPTNY